MIDLQEVWDKYDDEYLNFKAVSNPLHNRPDIAAFLLMDKLIPENFDGKDMVCGARHLAEVATEEDVLTLVRCGVRLIDGNYLAMFV
jgi:hypothetical protein